LGENDNIKTQQTPSNNLFLFVHLAVITQVQQSNKNLKLTT